MHIVFLVGLVILALMILIYSSPSDSQNVVESFGVNFYKCPKFSTNKLTKNVFREAGFNRSYDLNNWDLYMPCGYNNVEEELKGLKTHNTDQKIFGINGCDFIVSKNGLWDIIEGEYGRHTAKTLMPETFIINRDSDMDLFKNSFSPTKLYLMKKNIQRKRGIKITNNLNEILGNTDNKFKVIQQYIPDLYLIKQRKVNLRIYLLISCFKGKVKAYVHRLGKCIYTNRDFKENDLNPEIHLTSLNVKNDVYDIRPQTFSDLQRYIGSDKYELLMNNIYNNLILVMKAARDKLCKLSNLSNNVSFQLFGLDYVFTNSMYPYLLEMNKGPDMNPKNDVDIDIKTKVIRDTYVTVGLIDQLDNTNDFMRLKID